MDMDAEALVNMGALYAPYIIIHDEWWRLFTAMFLHGGMMHIVMNMFSLYLIGRGAEMYFDKKSYISIYLFSGLIGGLISIYMHSNSVGVGASGAIFGLFGALAGFFLAHKEQLGSHTIKFMKSFGMIIGINLIIGLVIPSVDVTAHIAGLVVGFIGGYIISLNAKYMWIYSISMSIISVAILYYLQSQYVTTLF